MTRQGRRGPRVYFIAGQHDRMAMAPAAPAAIRPQPRRGESNGDTSGESTPGTRDPGSGNLKDPLENVKPGSGNPGRARESEQTNDAGQPHCPIHQNPALQGRTSYKNLKAIMSATGDVIRYCWGANGSCSWVHSRDRGTVVEAGGRRLDAQGIETAYNALQPAPTGNARQPRESKTPYADAVRAEMGRLPWESR